MMNTRVEMNEEMMAQVSGGELFQETDQDGVVLTPEREALRKGIRKEARKRLFGLDTDNEVIDLLHRGINWLFK